MKKAVGEYKRIAGAKVNFDKSEGLRLGAWRGRSGLFSVFSDTGKQSASIFCRWGDGRATKRGIFSIVFAFLFLYIAGFFSYFHHINHQL